MKKSIVSLLIAQGIYFFITGLWPLVHLNSFLFVTGPKTDIWLVKAMSLLIVCIGLTLLKCSSEKNNSPAIYLLAVISAVSLLFIDVYYPYRGIISKIYIADGVVQFTFLILWLCIIIKRPIPLQRF